MYAVDTASLLASPPLHRTVGSDTRTLRMPDKYSNTELSFQPTLNLFFFFFNAVVYLIYDKVNVFIPMLLKTTQ